MGLVVGSPEREKPKQTEQRAFGRKSNRYLSIPGTYKPIIMQEHALGQNSHNSMLLAVRWRGTPTIIGQQEQNQTVPSVCLFRDYILVGVCMPVTYRREAGFFFRLK